MSTFTMALHEAIEFTGGRIERPNGIAIMVGGEIGLNDYPLFDENYRDTLNGLIIDNYYNREIGVETINMFVHNMRTQMHTIMPFYNKLYESEKIAYDPLSTINLKTIGSNGVTQTMESTGTANVTSLTEAGSRATNLDTPQMLLAGNKDYATNAVDTTSAQNGESENVEASTNSSETDGNSETNTTGFQGVASDLIMRYRESLINVSLSIINELNPNFMGVFDSSANYFNNSYPYGGYYA